LTFVLFYLKRFKLGGLLIAMKEEDALGFIKELEEIDNEKSWIIGKVISSPDPSLPNSASISANPIVIEVS
jgi:hypothetical protein